MRIMITRNNRNKLQTVSTSQHTYNEQYHDTKSNDYKPTGRMILRVDPITPDVILHPLTHDRYVTLPTRSKTK